MGCRQNVDPPFWTPLLDPFLDPLLDPFLDPSVFFNKKIIKKEINILKNASKQIIKSPTITPSCTFYHEARKVTG